MSVKIFLLTIVICFTAALAGCGGGSDGIFGKWAGEYTDENGTATTYTYVFNSDCTGDVLINGVSKTSEAGGRCSVIWEKADDEIIITFYTEKDGQTFADTEALTVVEKNGRTMTVIADGKRIRLTRK